jgi:hypothetical protein
MQNLAFDEVLEVIDTLSLDEQETLLSIVRQRFTEHTRQQLAADIQAARAEFNQGACQPTSVGALMTEILS